MFSKKSQSREALLPVLDDQFLAVMNGGGDSGSGEGSGGSGDAGSAGQAAGNLIGSIG